MNLGRAPGVFQVQWTRKRGGEGKRAASFFLSSRREEKGNGPSPPPSFTAVNAAMWRISQWKRRDGVPVWNRCEFPEKRDGQNPWTFLRLDLGSISGMRVCTEKNQGRARYRNPYWIYILLFLRFPPVLRIWTLKLGFELWETDRIKGLSHPLIRLNRRWLTPVITLREERTKEKGREGEGKRW